MKNRWKIDAFGKGVFPYFGDLESAKIPPNFKRTVAFLSEKMKMEMIIVHLKNIFIDGLKPGTEINDRNDWHQFHSLDFLRAHALESMCWGYP